MKGVPLGTIFTTFTAEEDALIRRWFGIREWRSRVAKQLGRHPDAIKYRARKLGLMRDIDAEAETKKTASRDDRLLAIYAATCCEGGRTVDAIVAWTGHGRDAVTAELAYLESKQLVTRDGERFRQFLSVVHRTKPPELVTVYGSRPAGGRVIRKGRGAA